MPWWKRNISLMVIGTVIGLLICEIGLRLADVAYPTFYQRDAELGASLHPYAEGWWSSEGRTYIRINSAGFRDREHTVAKAPRAFRIAVLGDSYAEAFQVPMEGAFWSVMERSIKGCPALTGREPEVLNFGVSGYGTAQELLMLRHRVWSYAPDVVILAFVSGNDVRNNSKALEQENKRPFFVLKNGRLDADMTFRQSMSFRLRQTEVALLVGRLWQSSRVLQVFDEVRRHIVAYEAKGPLSSIGVNSARASEKPNSELGVMPWEGYAEAGLDALVYREPADPVWEEAWQVTEGLIVKMRDEVRDHGAEFLLVTLSNGPQVHPDLAVRQAFEKHLGVPHLFYPEVRLRDLGGREHVSVFNLAPLFQTYAEEHRVFLHGFKNTGLGRGHWNSEGHRIAGTLIAEKLCSNLMET